MFCNLSNEKKIFEVIELFHMKIPYNSFEEICIYIISRDS